MKHYDVVVIGSGVGGSTAAYALQDAGKSVAMVEEADWGGTCPNRGCDPKKILISGMEVVERNNQLAGKGFSTLHSIKWPELMAFKRNFTGPYPQNFKKEAQQHGVETITGTAKFLNDTQIQVEEETIEANVFIIATGQRSSILDIQGKEHLKTSTDFLELEELPETITFIGAGYIAFELAAIANAAGSTVTIIDHGSRPLRGFDEGLVSELVKTYKTKGIKFVFDTDIQQVKKEGNQILLTGENYSAQTSYVVCATGRIPNIEHLDLAKANIEYDKRGITVNEYLQTSNTSVFACGDVISKKQPKLTPVSTFEGNYLVQRVLGKTQKGIEYPSITSIVYGSPRLATVGISTEQAKEETGKYSVKEVDMTEWFSYRRLNEPVAKAKLVFEREQLVGAGVLSNQADDLINYLAIIIEKKITHQEISRMIMGWPTIASDLSSLI